jgi:hypothetical protein
LLGAGVGAVLAVYLGFVPWFADIANTVQVFGIGLAVGSLILRVVLSERGLRLTDHAGLLSNWICTVLAGAMIILLFRGLPWPQAQPMAWPALVLVTVIAIPAEALVVFGLLISASLAPTAGGAGPTSKD